MGHSRILSGSFVAITLCWAQCTHAADAEMEALKKQMAELIRMNQQQQERIEALEKMVGPQPSPAVARDGRAEGTPVAVVAPTPQPTADAASVALDKAVEETEATTARPDLFSRQIGSTRFRLIDLSLDTLVAAGTSTAPNDVLKDLQGGGHDPNRRGFTLQQAELSFAGAVDPYLNGEAHIVFTTGGVELEEAFMTTQALPYGLQVEAGHFLTEYGLINPLHPHAWDWIDQPFINTRLMGPDGLRAPGFRVGWLTPMPWFSELHFGMQNANEGETTASFISEDGVGGRPVIDRSVQSLGDLLYLARWNNSWNLTDEWTALFGVSGLYGPNATGEDGETWIYGVDLKVRWRPHDNFRGWPFFLWQTEVSKRDYTADWFLAGTGGDPSSGGHSHGGGEEEPEEEEEEVDVPGGILRDAGFYTQALYGFRPGWAAGMRFEYASGSGKSFIDGELVSRQQDPLRADRFRFSPLLVWQPTEFSRFRLQYNYDDAKFLSGGNAHTFWIGGEILYGAHPAHKY